MGTSLRKGGVQALAYETKFTLATYSGTWNGGIFAGLADNSDFTLGANVFQISYDNGLLTLTSEAAIPEPASLAAIGLPAAIALLRRRKTHR